MRVYDERKDESQGAGEEELECCARRGGEGEGEDEVED